MIEPSRPFSSGMEYEFFHECFCERCNKLKLDEDFMPTPDNCNIENAMAEARFDITKWPKDEIVRSEDHFHICTKFETADKRLMKLHKDLLK
jgi:hypothetical protein